MPAPDRTVEVFKVHPATLWVTVFAALLLQAVLPLKIPMARLFDFPLLTILYFALLRRNKVFGTFLGTGVGLLQDTLAHEYIGIFGMAKALVGYLAASASVKFDVEQLVPRIVLAGGLVLVHNLFRLVIQRGLLEIPPPFHPLDLASRVLVNIALGLILFQALDRFKKPT